MQAFGDPPVFAFWFWLIHMKVAPKVYLVLLYPTLPPWGGNLCVVTLAVCKESRLYPTRLETRTKESNMYASQWVH